MGQYIGARYVPRFMGTFDPTQAYENLDVVDNGLGTSYISKAITPPGTSLTDTTYWALYGASSGAIINLQNQIGDLSDLTTTDQSSLVNAINELDSENQALANKTEKKQLSDCRFVFITDSFGGMTNSSGRNFYQEVAYRLGLTADNFDIKYLGSQGFKNDEFTALLQSSTITDKDTVDYVIVVGGNNDRNASESAIKSGMASFVSEARTSFPNANIIIGYDAWNYFSGASSTYIMRAYNTYKNYSQVLGVEFADMQTAIHAYAYCVDGIHPTASGVDRLADSLMKYLTSKNASLDIDTTNLEFTSTIVTAQSRNIQCKLYDNNVVIFLRAAATWTTDPSTNIGTALISLGTVDNSCFNCWGDYLWIDIFADIVHSGGTSQNVKLMMLVLDGVLDIRNFTGQAFNGVSSITIKPFTATIPAHIC